MKIVYKNNADLQKNYKIQKWCHHCEKINAKNPTFKCIYCNEGIEYYRVLSKTDKTDKFILTREQMELIEKGSLFYVENRQVIFKEECEDEEFDKFDKETSKTQEDNSASEDYTSSEPVVEDETKPEVTSLPSEETVDNIKNTEEASTSSSTEETFEDFFKTASEDTQESTSLPQVKESDNEENINNSNSKESSKTEPQSKPVKEETPILPKKPIVSTTENNSDSKRSEDVTDTASESLKKENEELNSTIKQMQEMLERQTAIINQLVAEKVKEAEPQKEEPKDEKLDESHTGEAPSKAIEPKYIPETTYGSVEVPADKPAWLNQGKTEEPKSKDEEPTNEDELRKKIREKVKREYEERERQKEEERLRIEFENKSIAIKAKEAEIEKDERKKAEKDIEKDSKRVVNVNNDGYYDSEEALEDDTFKKSLRGTVIKGIGLFVATLAVLYGVLYIVQNFVK